MPRRDFIRKNRETIDAVIRAGGFRGTINDNDRSDWIANDESLYLMARRAGVKV